MNNPKICPDRLKKKRQRTGYTLQDVASIIDIDPSTFHYWEQGATQPSDKYIPLICEALNCDLFELWTTETKRLYGRAKLDVEELLESGIDFLEKSKELREWLKFIFICEGFIAEDAEELPDNPLYDMIRNANSD